MWPTARRGPRHIHVTSCRELHCSVRRKDWVSIPHTKFQELLQAASSQFRKQSQGVQRSCPSSSSFSSDTAVMQNQLPKSGLFSHKGASFCLDIFPMPGTSIKSTALELCSIQLVQLYTAALRERMSSRIREI